MITEKTININGQDVKMRYCAAAETGYEKISGKSSAVFLPKLGKNEKGEIVVEAAPEAKSEDFILLGVAAIFAAYGKDNQEAPISLEYVLFDAQPTEVTSIITSVVELRNKWYEVPATVDHEQKGDTTKNPQQPAKRSKRS